MPYIDCNRLIYNYNIYSPDQIQITPATNFSMQTQDIPEDHYITKRRIFVYFESENDQKNLKQLAPSISFHETRLDRDIKQISFPNPRNLYVWKRFCEEWRKNGINLIPLDLEPGYLFDKLPIAFWKKRFEERQLEERQLQE